MFMHQHRVCIKARKFNFQQTNMSYYMEMHLKCLNFGPLYIWKMLDLG